MATPMAGTWEQAIPAMILATSLLRFALALVAVALGAASARQHHLRVGLLRYSGHHAGHVLKGQAIAECDLDGVVDVAADFQHAQPIALQHGAALLRAERETFEIRGFV